MQRLALLLAAILVFIGFFGVQANRTTAQTPEDIVAVITFPATGQQLFGLVNILGSAGHPTAFNSYTLEYNDLGNPGAPWLLVQPRVQQQVRDDVLGTWNTTVVPDGTYQIRLRVFLDDGQVGETIVSNLKVVNSQPTPVPTAATGADVAPVIATPGPSPTSPVEQPPSNNPSASGIEGLGPASDSEIGPSSGTSTGRAKSETRINTSRIRSAFCAGVYLTLAAFGVLLAYSLVRGRLRPYTRRLSWQPQDTWRDDQ
jgi:hypothetical protein